MGENNQYWVLGDLITVIHSGDDYGMLQVVTLPHLAGPPPHYLEESTVLYHVIEGELEILIDGALKTLAKYESVRIPKGTLHELRNRSDREVTWLGCWSPGGPERMIIDYGVPATEEKACERSIGESMLTPLLTNAGRYGMRIPELDAGLPGPGVRNDQGSVRSSQRATTPTASPRVRSGQEPTE